MSDTSFKRSRGEGRRIARCTCSVAAPVRRFTILAIAAALSACASHPKMQPGVSLEAERGYWVQKTSFRQAGQEVDRESVQEELEATEESASAAKVAEVMEVGANITRVAGVLLVLWGASQRVGGTEVSQETSTKLLIGGGATLGVSIGLAFGADGLYVKAVDRYNEELHSFDIE